MKKHRRLKPSVVHKTAQRLRLLGLLDCPLRVTEVQSENDWLRVAALRKVRYEEKLASASMPEGAEPDDFLPTVKVVLVEHKVTGELLGTIRYRDTTQGPAASGLDEYIPARLTDQHSYSWADRLVVARSSWAALAKAMLMKAYYYLSVAAGVEYMSLHTRETLEPSYRKMGFKEQNGEVIRMENYGSLGAVPHSFLVLPVMRVCVDFDARLVPFLYRRHAGIDWPQRRHASALLKADATRTWAKRLRRAMRAA
jgi:hypothetical protein